MTLRKNLDINMEIYQNINNLVWYSLCNKCNCVRTYTSKNHAQKAKRLNRVLCIKCKKQTTEWKQKQSNIHKGHIPSEETRKKLSIASKGRTHSQETRNKISIINKGRKPSLSTRIKMSESAKTKILTEKQLNNWWKPGQISCNKGKKFSNEVRANMRLGKLKRMETLGIPASEDEGSKEWFYKYNIENNTKFKKKIFKEIGYIADGYDEEKHVWIEYDTVYHKRPSQYKKDIIRQNNIINFFNGIGKPLNEFKRVKVYNNYEIITVYKKELGY